MQKNLFFLFLVFTTSIAQGQLISDSILIESHYRSFHFLKPAKALASLVFVLHGSGGNGKGMRNSTQQLETIAPHENILLVYPDGYQRYWNECRRTAQSVANMENINENAFFQSMIDYFNKQYAIDTNKVFAVGTSGGGHMAYKLGLTMPEKFRAITALIANLPDTNNMDCIEKKMAIPVMIVNGTADRTNPYTGGEVLANGISLGLVRSTDRTFKYWYELAGYTGVPKMETLPDTDPADRRTIEKYTFSATNKPEVTLLKVINGAHNYPGDIDVHLEAWAFFKRQIN